MDANINSTTHGPCAALQWWMLSPGATNGSSAFAATLERAKRAQRGTSRRPASVFDGPPPEVEREMDAAASASRTLAARGQELRFGRDPEGRVLVELTDTSGRALYAIGPAELFRLLGEGD